jgi:hypothetical protein
MQDDCQALGSRGVDWSGIQKMPHLAHVVVGVSLQVQEHATRQPGTQRLASMACTAATRLLNTGPHAGDLITPRRLLGAPVSLMWMVSSGRPLAPHFLDSSCETVVPTCKKAAEEMLTLKPQVTASRRHCRHCTAAQAACSFQLAAAAAAAAAAAPVPTALCVFCTAISTYTGCGGSSRAGRQWGSRCTSRPESRP